MSTDTHLAPEYMHFTAEFIGAILAKALLAGMPTHDVATVTMTVLWMHQCPKVKEEFEARLRDKGDRVFALWRENYNRITRYNDARVAQTERDLNTTLERISKGVY